LRKQKAEIGIGKREKAEITKAESRNEQRKGEEEKAEIGNEGRSQKH
jgi:hypothetical protein